MVKKAAAHDDKSYYCYWGKARLPEDKTEPACHLLPYHCLDVAAVASVWWDEDRALRDLFLRACNVENHILKAWMLFFVALHDLGKFDVRFQLKVKDLACSLNPLFSKADFSQSRDFDHGRYGRYWFLQERNSYGFNTFDDTDLFHWISSHWISSVCGHHGRGVGTGNCYSPSAEGTVIKNDRKARAEWVEELKGLFLVPARIDSIDQLFEPPALLAGFCSVCDWLGSHTDYFPFNNKADISINEYFQAQQSIALSALRASGMIGKPALQGGMEVVYPTYHPRGIQHLVTELPIETGLTLIEAPTGSGKTEAAIAYASRLLAAALADSIVFALPTQATANAMLERLEEAGKKLFPDGVNVVLAHGKAGFNRDFIKLKNATIGKTAQGTEEAFAQCTQWLATSRKRVFLGQIGVCTIDQVLLSVLPVRHNFVRAFGIRKSILIVDEIHAYDSYMNGLLDHVLERQREAGGSAILLSATLPSARRSQIFEKWGSFIPETNINISYPLVTHAGIEVSNWESPEREENHIVKVTAQPTENMLPDNALLDEMLKAAIKGALVVIICNLVKDAQKVSRRLKQLMMEKGVSIGIDLFHSRFRFMDRQKIEMSVMEKYGKGPLRASGRILVSTQVVEQSLDLDFDWMITQLCPIDLLFQRLGRLYRHQLRRPQGFDNIPRCKILIPSGEGYGHHSAIYEDERVLWRTQKLLEKAESLEFPFAYRELIEKVYAEQAWPDEPEEITSAHKKYVEDEEGKRVAAMGLAHSDATPFADTDGNASKLTRDGEMSLNVVPVLLKRNKRYFLDGAAIDKVPEWERDEVINMNTIPVPYSWKPYLPDDEEGLIYLPMMMYNNDRWRSIDGIFTYYRDFGLEKEK
jgi:CRISPR-associated endonuclease/helicase Cas3